MFAWSRCRCTDSDGVCWVGAEAYFESMVKEAPKATGDHVITHDVEVELREYYTV